MHIIDLDTLNEERLIQSVDPETYLLGVDLFSNGSVEVAEVSESTAKCTVLDKRYFHVNFRIEKQNLLLKCSCSHASRGLICEHEVAAYLAIRKSLMENLPPEWKLQLERTLEIAESRTPSIPIASYYLFFSLQKEAAHGVAAWQLVPLYLPERSIPAEIIKTQSTDLDWEKITVAHPDLLLRIRTPTQPLNSESCINGDRESVSLANLLLSTSPQLLYSFFE